MTVRERQVGVTPEAVEPRVCAAGATVSSLVEHALTGDRDAFGLIVHRRTTAAMRLAVGILGEEADARDAVQDAFLGAWRHLGQLRDPERFDPWLDRIVVNRCRELRRSRGRTRVREIRMDPWALDDPPGARPFDGPEEAVASLDEIERAFDRLDVEDRAILVLHHLEHRSLPEIAASLAIPVGTAKSRLFAARRALERALEAEVR